MLSLYYLELINLTFDSRAKSLLPYVSDERQNKIAGYHFDIDRLLSLYGALLIEFAIRPHIPMRSGLLEFNYNKQGKPFLSGCSDVFFNLSHTRNCIVCGISSTDIGVDIEKLREPPYEIMKNIFTPKEILLVTNASPEMKPELFFQIWTQKEAYVKLTGTGLQDNINTIDTLHPLAVNYATFRKNGYISSVCTLQKDVIKHIIVTEKEIYDFITPQI